jgi:hypothetical protein
MNPNEIKMDSLCMIKSVGANLSHNSIMDLSSRIAFGFAFFGISVAL